MTTTTADLLFELGTEELPAGFVDPACAFLQDAVPKALAELGLAHGQIVVDGTPRRLVVVARSVQAQQADREDEVTGPKAEFAWDQSGKLTAAGEGFLRGKGLTAEDAYKKETKKGVLLAVRIREKGRPAQDVLGPALEALIPKIPFKKTMRWGDETKVFARPLQWILALFDGAVLPVSYAGVTSGKTTRGHRFHSPAAVAVSSLAEYEAALQKGQVVLSRAARKQAIVDGANALAAKSGGELLADEPLLEIVKNLVEKPFPILGRFEDRFLAMPGELLRSEMREHQKYFAVVDGQGAIRPAFVVVAGSDPGAHADVVAAGNARVLRARFEDGAFYFGEDAKKSLDEHAAKLSGVVFHRELGTVADKVARVQALVEAIAEEVGVPADVKERAHRAAQLAKADLASGVVKEFPELQGIMGRHYAAKQGEHQDVAKAIEEHYAPRHAGAALPTTIEGALVGVADRLDTIVGILGVGKAPTGSADPFALRRASIAVAHVLMDRGWRAQLHRLVADAIRGYGDRFAGGKGDALVATATEFMRSRLTGVLVERVKDEGLQGAEDIVEAAIGAGAEDLPDLEARTVALARLRASDKDAFLRLAATFKRVGNILEKARGEGNTTSGDALDPSALVEPAEKGLLTAVERARASSAEARGTLVERHGRALDTIAALKPAVDAFFDDVMVMAEDPKTRSARLALLSRVAQMLDGVADFTRVQIPT